MLRHRFASRSDRRALARVTIFHACIAAAAWAVGGLHWYVLLWVIPFVLTNALVGSIIELAEHFPLVGREQDSYSLFVTSRNRHSRLFERLLLGIHHESYHMLHHLEPRIPFWNLPRAHELMLEHPDYRAADARMGGVFTSTNGAESIFRQMHLLLRSHTP